MRVGVDIGGTFTDGAVIRPNGALEVLKVPTTSDVLEDSTREVLRQLSVVPKVAQRLVHGTTVITNLLIERRGGRVALLTTAGFEDVLELQFGDKPNTYDISWTKPEPFVPRPQRFGVHERIDSTGEVLVPLSDAELGRVVEWLDGVRCDAVAVCLLNSYANDLHERLLERAISAQLPHVECCISSKVDPLIREYERMSTTVLNAYAMPTIAAYVGERQEEWGDVYYMASRGGVVTADVAASVPISLAFSGPAAGVVGAAALGNAMGYGDVITFDMGGTSTDVSIVRNGSAEMRQAVEIDSGIPCRFPSVDITSVGAGGGSILWLDTGRALRVGPQSAGSDPGPACYGRDGRESTITDVDLVLGLIVGDSLGCGSISLVPEAAREGLSRIAGAQNWTIEEAAVGAWRIVNATIAQTIRGITVYKGIDPRDFALFCFGSAAGQHAVEIARELRIPRVIVPAVAAVFAAVGMLSARVELYGSCSLDCELDQLFKDQGPIQRMRRLKHDLLRSHARENLVTASWTLDCRHVGQTHALDVAFDPEQDTSASVLERFLHEHRRLYGVTGDTNVEVVNARVCLAAASPEAHTWKPAGGPYETRLQNDSQRVVTERDVVEVIPRYELSEGNVGVGPALIADATSTVYVPKGSPWFMDDVGSIVVDTR